MIGICLGAALGLAEAFLPTAAFTLTWTHSVEKIAWQEDYQVADGRLVLIEARVKGSGAGMDPPADAVLRNGWWHYRPELPPLEKLRLTRSTVVEGYSLCLSGKCTPLSAVLPVREEGGVTEVWACGGPS